MMIASLEVVVTTLMVFIPCELGIEHTLMARQRCDFQSAIHTQAGFLMVMQDPLIRVAFCCMAKCDEFVNSLSHV